MHILIVDDNIDLVQLLMVACSSEQYQSLWPQQKIPLVLAAYHGHTAIELVQWQPVDLVVLDISLPDMHGFEVVHQMRALSQVPIMMLTARNEKEMQRKARTLGAADYVIKPFDLDDLLQRMAHVLTSKHLG